MSELIRSFLAVALCGSLLGILVPENKMEKPMTFLTSTVLLIAMLTLFGNFTKTINFKNITPDFFDNDHLEVEMQKEAARGIEYTLEDEISKAVENFCGEKPLNIKIEVDYKETFNIDYIKIYMRSAEESSLIEYLKSTFNLDLKKTKIIIVITESAYIQKQ